MAHKLSYYKELQSNGHLWRLEILQDVDGIIPIVREIGNVLQSLRLIVQGDQADIDTPIVKTSLEMVFADAVDLEIGVGGKKLGDWEIFYTSSSTEYKVILYKDGNAEWSGYITPDSYSESLMYHGSVTIIARDNLGALQDYEYSGITDYTGMISAINIINQALTVISFPMQQTIMLQGVRRFPFTLESQSTKNIYTALFNNHSFKDKTWLEAVESVLMATGMVLRYVGSNKFVLSSIRDIPLYDSEYFSDVKVLDAIFCATGTRELSPAVKTLVDSVNFDIDENIAEVDMPAKAYGEGGEYEFLENNEAAAATSYQMPVHQVKTGSWLSRDVAKSLCLNAFAYPLMPGHSSKREGDIRDTSVVYLAANQPTTSSGRSAAWRVEIGPGKYRFSFVAGKPLALYEDNTKVGHIDTEVNLSRFIFSLKFGSNDGSELREYRSSSDSWINNHVTDPNSTFPNIGFPASFEFPEFETTKIGVLELTINYVGVQQLLSSPVGESKGAYVAIQELRLVDVNLENTAIAGSSKTTTNYNDKNNVMLSRSLDYGFNPSEVASPKIVNNGMYIKTAIGWYDSSDQWVFNNGDQPNAFPVLMHQQLLPYYSKPNNVLTGELATAEPAFNALYSWNGKKHYLASGALNIISGRMENVVLREFKRYDEMWETWLEEDVFTTRRAGGFAKFTVHSKKEITTADISAPSWISVALSHNGENTIVTLNCAANSGSGERVGVVTIDTAKAKVVQK